MLPMVVSATDRDRRSDTVQEDTPRRDRGADPEGSAVASNKNAERDAREARDRLRRYNARQSVHSLQTTRRRRDNVIAIVGVAPSLGGKRRKTGPTGAEEQKFQAEKPIRADRAAAYSALGLRNP